MMKKKLNDENARILEDQQEIAELKEFIEKVYFKQNEQDQQMKEYFNQSILELEEITGDDDFSLHLAKIYTKVVSRQRENLEEFEGYSDIMNNFKIEIEQKEKEASEELEELIDEKYQNIAENIIDLQSQLTKQEIVFRADEQVMDTHLNAILKECKVSRIDYDRRRQEENMREQGIDKKMQMNLEIKGDIVKDIHRSRQYQKEEEAKLLVIKERIAARKEQIKVIERNRSEVGKQISFGGKTNGIAQNDQDNREEQIQKVMHYNVLQRQKESFDDKIIRLEVLLADYKDDSKVIEKRFQLGRTLFSNELAQQMETLLQEEMELMKEIEDLQNRAIIAEGSRKQRLAEEQIKRNSNISTNQGKNIQLLLYVITGLFILALIFKWF